MQIFNAFVVVSAVCSVACMPDNGEGADGEEIAAAPMRAAASTAAAPVSLDSAIALAPVASGNLSVATTVHARRDHRYLWDMTMTNPPPIALAPGAVQRVSFPVDIVNTGTVDTGAVDGTIQIQNSGKRAVTLLGVIAQVGEVAATVTCPSRFPATLAGRGTMTCTYAVSLPDARDRSLVAVAFGSDVAYALQAVSFSDPSTATQDLDRVVEATAPGVGHVYLADATFEPVVHTSFSREVGPYTACGPFAFVATANLRALNGSGSLRSGLLRVDRSATLSGTVVCVSR